MISGVFTQTSTWVTKNKRWKWFSAYLGQVTQLVGIEQQFLQTPSITINLIGHKQQRAVAFIDHLDVTVAPPQGYTVKHHGGRWRGATQSRTRAINERRPGDARNRLQRRDSPAPSNTHERKPTENQTPKVPLQVSRGSVTERTFLMS